MNKKIAFVIGLMFFFCNSEFSLAASFDCSKAIAKTEMLICSDSNLSGLDDDLALAYKNAREGALDKESIKRDQLAWLRSVRDCQNVQCLRIAYENRIRFLLGVEGGGKKIQALSPVHPWKLIASGDEHSCVASDDEIRCWGNNNGGALNLPRGFNKITQLNSTWSTAVCAKDSAGWECWGECDAGICDIPVGYKDADKLAPGASHVCGVKNGLVKCWGKNKYGQIDAPNNLNNVIDIAVNNNHSCALLRNGKVKCWGREKYNLIYAAEALFDAKKISTGLYSTCVLTLSNKIGCGFSDGQEIDGFGLYSNVEYIVAGTFSVCFIHSHGRLYCLGEKIQGFNDELITDKRFFSVSVGRSHVCGLSESGVLCWGSYANENPDLYKVPYSAKDLVNKNFLSK